MSYRSADSLRAASEQNLFHPDPACKLLYSKNKFGEISASSWFYYKKDFTNVGAIGRGNEDI
jgi:hypothetical protein